MLSTALLTATVLSFGVRAPPNAVNVTFYNLRPHNMSTDIIEKDSVSSILSFLLPFVVNMQKADLVTHVRR